MGEGVLLMISIFIQAVRETARLYGTTPKSVRKILKEMKHFGNLVGPPYTRTTHTAYEKLSLSLKDEIRKKVKKGPINNFT